MTAIELKLTVKLGTVVLFGMVTLKIMQYVARRCRYDYKTRRKKVFLCENNSDWIACRDILVGECEKSKYLGIDCEWVPENHSKQAVALLQLATESGTCVLLRLSHLPKPLPSKLINLMNDKSILKVGVACIDDAKRLQNDHDISVQGCLDLRYVFKAFSESYDSNVRALGLKSLAKFELDVVMEKDWRTQCSDWECRKLSKKQIDYAVQDAIIAVDIFHEIMRKQLLSNSLLLLSYSFSAFTNVKLGNHWSHIAKMCEHFVDRQFRQKSPNNNNSNNKKFCNNKKMEPNTGSRAFSTRSKPLYENCQLIAPDGQLLCTCNTKKAQWYLSKDMGVLVKEDPMTVQLNFEPNGRPVLDGAYYTYDKDNICVVCGRSERLLKKHIVPHEYRRYFPDVLKSHSSHDVVLLCVDCNLRCNQYDSVNRQRLAELCNAPIGTEEDVKVYDNPELKQVKSAARAILRSRDKLPKERLEELNSILSSYFNTTEIVSDEQLKKCSELDTSVLNTQYVSHGEKVVSYMSKRENNGLLEFELSWRNQFVNNMKPEFLPKMWSTCHGHERLAMSVSEITDADERQNLSNVLGLQTC